MFEIEVRHERSRQLVAPLGELDIATRDHLEQVLTPLLDGDFEHVVVDLRGVDFMDATAAGLLIASLKRAEDARTRFSLILGARSSYRVLELCGLLGLFEVISGLEDPPA